LRDTYRSVLSQRQENFRETHAETFFGLGLGLSRSPDSDYVDQVVDCIYRAAQLDYAPAQAICAQILRAHKKHLPSLPILIDWERNSLKTGYLLSLEPSSLTVAEQENARAEFRWTGGHCADGFMSDSRIFETASNPSRVAELISEQGPTATVDLEGNTIAHVVAALGVTYSLRTILNHFPEQVLSRNGNGETLLYKACQAGQMSILKVLRETSIDLPILATTKERMTPLHWLFVFRDADVDEACNYLVGPNKENINAQMVAEASSSGQDHDRFPMLH
jgi:hypothetical protein